MPTKVSAATKRTALEKLREGLTEKEVAKLTSVSLRTVTRWHSEINKQSSSKPSSTTALPKVAPLANPVDEHKTTLLDFEEAPVVVEKKGVVDSALNSLKGMLGIADKKEAKTPQPVFTAKLDAKRQQFVDSFSPTLSLAFMGVASYLWGRIDADYSGLAPDEDVAAKIVTPLLRIYARHANFMTDINPDMADAGASIFALVAYVHVSLKMYQIIKKEKEEADENRDELGSRRGFRPGDVDQKGTGNASDRPAPVRGRSRGDDNSNGTDGGYPSSLDSLNLPPKEAAQYQALSRLSELDYLSRARRSGRA